jgi:hypothetical protein
VVILSPAPPAALAPPAESAPKSPVSTAAIVLIAVVAVAAIISIFVFSTLYPINFNRANSTNQTNVTRLSFNLQQGKPQASVLDQNLTDKTGFSTVSATGALSVYRPHLSTLICKHLLNACFPISNQKK